MKVFKLLTSFWYDRHGKQTCKVDGFVYKGNLF